MSVTGIARAAVRYCCFQGTNSILTLDQFIIYFFFLLITHHVHVHALATAIRHEHEQEHIDVMLVHALYVP